eukprot:1404715-Pyramimonas_sp.AAC.1
MHIINATFAAGPTCAAEGCSDRRLDHIAMRECFAKSAQECYTKRDFDSGLKVQGHFPVIAAMRCVSTRKQ